MICPFLLYFIYISWLEVIWRVKFLMLGICLSIFCRCWKTSLYIQGTCALEYLLLGIQYTKKVAVIL